MGGLEIEMWPKIGKGGKKGQRKRTKTKGKTEDQK